jgi:hypothetical protein
MVEHYSKMVWKSDEVSFVDHKVEFIRFYEHHYAINSEISGLKEIRAIENNVEKKLYITRERFWLGIKRVQGFIMDNIHYVKRYDSKKKLIRDMYALETNFLADDRYEYLSKRETRTTAEDLEFNYAYVHYLVCCFELVNQLCRLLQPTLMINTRSSKKDVIYNDDAPFFIKLGEYRDEVSNDLANFKLFNILDHYKRLIGYYYSYKVLFIKEELLQLDPIVEMVSELVNSKEIVDLLTYMSEHTTYSPAMLAKIKLYAVEVKSIFFSIYSLTNAFLSERRVLPKVKTREVMDFTLI